MKRRRVLNFARLVLFAVLALPWGISQIWAQSPQNDKLVYRDGKPTAEEKKAAAQRAKALSLKPGVAGLASSTPSSGFVPTGALPTTADPGGAPHYFGPYGNWAYSPLPKGTLNAAITVDTTVAFSRSYLYRVKTVNGAGSSGYITLASAVVVPVIPAAPTNFRVVSARNGANDSATLSWSSTTNPVSFTIERAAVPHSYSVRKTFPIGEGEIPPPFTNSFFIERKYGDAR
jgi:hypothetical protein